MPEEETGSHVTGIDPLLPASAERVDASAVHNRIRSRWDDLPAASLRVATVVLGDPRLVLELGVNELAERAGPHPPR